MLKAFILDFAPSFAFRYLARERSRKVIEADCRHLGTAVSLTIAARHDLLRFALGVQSFAQSLVGEASQVNLVNNLPPELV